MAYLDSVKAGQNLSTVPWTGACCSGWLVPRVHFRSSMCKINATQIKCPTSKHLVHYPRLLWSTRVRDPTHGRTHPSRPRSLTTLAVPPVPFSSSPFVRSMPIMKPPGHSKYPERAYGSWGTYTDCHSRGNRRLRRACIFTQIDTGEEEGEHSKRANLPNQSHLLNDAKFGQKAVVDNSMTGARTRRLSKSNTTMSSRARQLLMGIKASSVASILCSRLTSITWFNSSALLDRNIILASW